MPTIDSRPSAVSASRPARIRHHGGDRRRRRWSAGSANPGRTEITSSSSLGITNITSSSISTRIDGAARDVQAASTPP